MRAVLLVVLLAGCATTKPVVKIVPIPPELTEQVPEPTMGGDKNSDLVVWALRLREALREANRRLQSIGSIKP